MPQLEVTTYLCQYVWKLITLFFLFSVLVSSILPRLQWQIVIRDRFNNVQTKKERIKLEIILMV